MRLLVLRLNWGGSRRRLQIFGGDLKPPELSAMGRHADVVPAADDDEIEDTSKPLSHAGLVKRWLETGEV